MIWLLGIILFVAGLVLPGDLLGDSTAALIGTFFGLLAAGILPAISLLVGSEVSATFSVARLNELEKATDAIVIKLNWALAFIIFGALLLSVESMMGSSFEFRLRAMISGWFPKLNIELVRLAAGSPRHALQAGVFTTLILSLDRLRLIGSAFRAARSARFDAAREQARRLLQERAPTTREVTEGYKTSPDFGAKVQIKVDPKD